MHDFLVYRVKHRRISDLSPAETFEGFMDRMREKAHDKDQLQAMARIAVENDPHAAGFWAEAHSHKDVTNALRDAWKQQITHVPNDMPLLSKLDLVPDVCEVRRLPFLSLNNSRGQ